MPSSPIQRTGVICHSSDDADKTDIRKKKGEYHQSLSTTSTSMLSMGIGGSAVLPVAGRRGSGGRSSLTSTRMSSFRSISEHGK